MAPRWNIPLSDVVGDDELAGAAAEAVRSGWWSMGPRVAEFEAEFGASSGSAHAFAVANGTAALHIALLAAGCGPGDEVVLPALNFVAAANTIAHTGARPTFCDIRGSDDLNLDPADLEEAINPSTRAIVALHYAGYPCDMDAVMEIAERHKLIVIEDAAHAPGGSWRGRPCGSFGAAGCFSFFSNKNLPIGEGGMIVTDDPGMAEQVRLLRSHGMTTLTWDRHRGHAHSYDVVARGFNYRLDEVRAAMGLVQLRRLSAGNAARARLVDCYRSLLHGVEGLEVPFASIPAHAKSSHHIAVVVLPEGSDRASLRESLTAAGVQTSVHYPPIHHFSAYKGLATRALPQTDALSERLLTLPLYPTMTTDQVDLVAASLVAALRRGGSSRAGIKSVSRSADAETTNVDTVEGLKR